MLKLTSFSSLLVLHVFAQAQSFTPTMPPSVPEAAGQAVESAKAEKSAAGKERILQLRGESFAAVRKSLESARAGGLSCDLVKQSPTPA